MNDATLITTLAFVLDLVIRIGLSIRVIMRRRPVGVSLAWLSIILIFPFGGALIYLAIGETRLGSRIGLGTAGREIKNSSRHQHQNGHGKKRGKNVGHVRSSVMRRCTAADEI